MIKFIFNLSKLILFSFYTKNIKNKSNKHFNLIKKYINNCGCICVKCVQWIIPLLEKENVNKNLLNKLSDVYENNYNQDIKHTEYLYKKHFYKDLNQHYKIINIIGSGSIAQVYKIQELKTNKIYVMKVKHPNIEIQIKLFKNIFKLIYKIKYFNELIYNFFPFDLIKFLEDFYKQSDFINESNNILNFYNNYKNNEYIIIPKLIKSSNDIIIMEYIEGICIDELDISEYNKSKIIFLLYLFIRNNMLITNNNHGDLHKFNWKVSKDTIKNVNKLIIYDYGYCFKKNKEEYKYINNLCNLIQTYDKNIPEKVEQYKNFLEFLFNKKNIKINIDFNHNITKPDILLNQILSISKLNKIIIKRHILLNTLLLMCLVDNIFTKYNLSNEPKIKIKYNLLNAYTFCEYHNIFKELSKRLLYEYKQLEPPKEIFETIKYNDNIKSLI